MILAKEIATLDRLSGGRVELGVGVGWLEEEFDALGVPFAARGRRTDEYIDVLRRLWREPETAFDGEFTKFAPLKSYPKPATADGPPIHIGGHTAAAARRAGRHRRRLLPGPRHRRRSRRAARRRCARAAKDAGRDPDAIEITSGGGLDLDTVQAATPTSASSRFIIPPLGFDLETLRTQLGNFSENVIAHAA